MENSAHHLLTLCADVLLVLQPLVNCEVQIDVIRSHIVWVPEVGALLSVARSRASPKETKKLQEPFAYH